MSPTIQVNSKHLEWNRQGIFALPTDTQDSYAKRAAKFQQSGSSCHILRYDIEPNWVEVEYSNKGLYPWEAGCSWYSDDANVRPLIQLREAFTSSSTYLCMYQKDEVLFHEYVHAVRAPLNASKFEEIFSYLVSLDYAESFFGRMLKSIRVCLGPLFEKSYESLILVCVLIVSLLLALFQSDWIPVSLMATSGILALLFFRLMYRWWQWGRCYLKLKKLFLIQALPLMLRLTDEEIICFSKKTVEQIKGWISEQSKVNFRWALLSCCYQSGTST